MEVTKVTYPNFKKTPPLEDIDCKGFTGQGCVRSFHNRSVEAQPLRPITKGVNNVG